jgi:hypothetical protein
MTPQREIRVDQILQRGEVQILEASGLDPCERLVAELRQRRSPPEGERTAEQDGRLSRIDVARFGDDPFEAMDIDLLRVDLEHVPGRPSHERTGRQHLAQA